MWPDRLSNPGPLALESDAPQSCLRDSSYNGEQMKKKSKRFIRVSVLFCVIEPELVLANS